MRRGAAGISLVEVLVGLVLIGVVVLSAVPMFVHAAKVTASGGDLGAAAALAEERMELLRKQAFNSLIAGGDLDEEVVGYVDRPREGFVVRWRITDGAGAGGSKLVEVRAAARRATVGRAKQVDLVGMRSR